MQILSNEAPSATPFPGIAHVTLAGSANGLRNLSVWHQAMDPGCATPPHRHDCEEVVLCTAGEGELRVDGRIERFSANTTIVIPSGVDHQIVSIGSEPLHTLAVLAASPVGVWLPDGVPVELPWPT